MSNRADNFNRTNQSPLGTPSDGGSAWVAQSGGGAQFKIVGNQAAEDFDSGETKDTLECGSADGDIQVTIVTFGDQIGLVGRLSDVDNFLWLRAYSGAGYDLFKKVANSNTNLGSYSTTPADGDVVLLSMSGNSLIVKINGVTRITATDSFNNTATKHGLFASGAYLAGTARLDNFSFTDTSVTLPTMSGEHVNGFSFSATLSESCIPSSGTGKFTLSGTSAVLSSWAISVTSFTATLAPAVRPGETVTLAYTRAMTSGDISDVSVTDFLADFSGHSVTNDTPNPIVFTIDGNLTPPFRGPRDVIAY